MSVVPKLVQWPNEIPSESQQDCFVDTRQFRWKGKESRIAKTILNKKNKVRSLVYSLLGYNIATIIKTVEYW